MARPFRFGVNMLTPAGRGATPATDRTRIVTLRSSCRTGAPYPGRPDAPALTRGHPGVMATPPITIHAPTPSGARPVTVHVNNRDERLGLAHSDHDLIVFLADAGLADPKRILDNRAVVQWQGAEAHQYKAA